MPERRVVRFEILRWCDGGEHLWQSLERHLRPRELIKELKDWLGRLYTEGDEKLRTCIVTATVEHPFEQKDIREFFSDWKKHPVRAIAHKEACEWYLGGDKTPPRKPPFGHPNRK
jgi:hypothetical protein